MTDLDRLIRSIRITAGYDDPVLMSAKQVFALTGEVERLREHRESCTENLLKGYETGKAEERAAVVAWLRAEAARLRKAEFVGSRAYVLESTAYMIENGVHADQKEKA